MMLGFSAEDMHPGTEGAMIGNPALPDIAAGTDVDPFPDFRIRLGENGAKADCALPAATGHGQPIKTFPQIIAKQTGEKAEKLGKPPKRSLLGPQKPPQPMQTITWHHKQRNNAIDAGFEMSFQRIHCSEEVGGKRKGKKAARLEEATGPPIKKEDLLNDLELGGGGRGFVPPAQKAEVGGADSTPMNNEIVHIKAIFIRITGIGVISCA